MDLTPKQQASEAIRQAETIVILTGAHPSVDQAAAAVGLSAILRKFGKKVSAVMSEGLPASVAQLEGVAVERTLGGPRDFILKVDTRKAEVDKLRYEVADNKLNVFITPYKGTFAPSDVTFDYGQPSFDYDLAIVLGVPTRARIDRAYEQNLALFEQIPLINLDFHRSNEGYGAVNLIDGNASSLCEMLVATSESLQSGLIDAEIGTVLLMGIMAATDRFTASHTTSKGLTVAAQMMAAGGKQPVVVKALYRGGGRDERGDRGGERNRNETRERQRDSSQRDSGQHGEAQRLQPSATTALAGATPVSEAVGGREERSGGPREERLPIIDPSHIELSEPPVAAEAAAPDAAPAPGENRPVMADFAAAAEVLAQQYRDDPGPASTQPDQNSGA